MHPISRPRVQAMRCILWWESMRILTDPDRKGSWSNVVPTSGRRYRHWAKSHKDPQIARFIGPTWDPPGSYRPQMRVPCWPHEPCCTVFSHISSIKAWRLHHSCRGYTTVIFVTPIYWVNFHRMLPIFWLPRGWGNGHCHLWTRTSIRTLCSHVFSEKGIPCGYGDPGVWSYSDCRYSNNKISNYDDSNSANDDCNYRNAKWDDSGSNYIDSRYDITVTS